MTELIEFYIDQTFSNENAIYFKIDNIFNKWADYQGSISLKISNKKYFNTLKAVIRYLRFKYPKCLIQIVLPVEYLTNEFVQLCIKYRIEIQILNPFNLSATDIKNIKLLKLNSCFNEFLIYNLSIKDYKRYFLEIRDKLEFNFTVLYDFLLDKTLNIDEVINYISYSLDQMTMIGYGNRYKVLFALPRYINEVLIYSLGLGKSKIYDLYQNQKILIKSLKTDNIIYPYKDEFFLLANLSSNNSIKLLSFIYQYISIKTNIQPLSDFLNKTNNSLY